ncbi:MAG TPA: histidine phosphatase family protein [Pyrinomonadaceae bacterium]|nr:histidine phosphatase family protein [Pyrinomonadaceae bacterium]
MKHLYLMRHAKSSWDDPSLADFDRPLNPRGLAAAPFIGEVLAGRGIVVDLILSSPARRARHTAELVRKSSGFACPLRFDERIYEASQRTLAAVVSELFDPIESALLIGHNPGFEGLLEYLSGNSSSMPTAAVAYIVLDVEKWAKISPSSGKLEWLITPKEELAAARG